jgi:hypothetical protein
LAVHQLLKASISEECPEWGLSRSGPRIGHGTREDED